jgi:alkanesulfonate monooxygenase SsuD/methylene tetrahydromethanopterin reductase-like flavin-dependent oxidoreductase (luciferase family)
MSEALPLAKRIRFGVMTAAPDREHAKSAVDAIVAWGYEVIWMGDHVAFTGHISDPLLQLTYMAALRPELTYGTSIYLLPLRHPTPVAKMIATLDRLVGAGQFIFGIGVGGEFPPEFEACGVPVKQRGGRATEAIQVIRRLWSEPTVEHHGRYFSFGPIKMEPKPATLGGPSGSGGVRRQRLSARLSTATDGCRTC